MKPWQWLALAAVALYLLLRMRGKQVAPTAGAGLPVGVSPKPGPTATTPPSSGPVHQLDVAGDIDELADTDVMLNNATPGSYDWKAQFYRQVWLPASKVPIASLTKDDFTRAYMFLGGQINGRRDDLGQRGRMLIQEAQGQASGALASSIIGQIGSIIPIIGQAFGRVMQQNASTLSAAAIGTAGDLANTLRTGFGNLDSVTNAVLDNSATSEDPLTNTELGTGIGLETVEHFAESFDTPGGNGLTYLQRYPWHSDESIGIVHTSTGDLQQIQYGPFDVSYLPRARFLTRTKYGWLFPWLDVYFNGADPDPTTGGGGIKVGLRETVNRRARVFRALDVLCCMSWSTRYPAFGPSGECVNKFGDCGGQANPFQKWRYFYRNKATGIAMLGSIFPPQLRDAMAGDRVGQDEHYVDAQGNEFWPDGTLASRHAPPAGTPGVTGSITPTSGDPEFSGGGGTSNPGAANAVGTFDSTPPTVGPATVTVGDLGAILAAAGALVPPAPDPRVERRAM